MSPPPQTQTQHSSPVMNSTAKANMILDSVVNSIQSSPSQLDPGQQSKEPVTPSPKRDLSPTSRRNRDLAQALFGGNSKDVTPPPAADQSLRSAYQQRSPSTPTLLERTLGQNRSTPEEPAPVPSPSPYPMQLSRNPSILRSPQGIVNQTELAREVQRKTEAATASLKRGPSTKYHDANASSTSISLIRKRIAPHQISAPHLVSASTSVDTIPLRSPSSASGNAPQQKPGKLGQRIKRWGTLRAKATVPNGDEITPFPLDARSARSSPPVQHAPHNTSNVNITEGPTSASLTEPVRAKAPAPSPPATSSPGLKGFMSRFRKPRAADTSPEHGRRSGEQDHRVQPQMSPAASSTASGSPLNEYVFPKQGKAIQSQSAPANKPTFQSATSSRVTSPDPLLSAPLTGWTGLPRADSQQSQPEINASDTVALKQLFDAASNLGLDQTALNDLLARSASTSSRSTPAWTMLTRNNSSVTDSRPPTRNDSLFGRARSPTTTPEDRPGTDEHKGDNGLSTVLPQKRVKPPRAYPEGQDDPGATAIVRRTIIFPSDSRTSTIDLNILTRKNSQSNRRRQSTSAASVTSSSRSVHDRAPTPPPPRSPTGRRFSHDASPPVPQLPASFSAQAESLLPSSAPRPTAASPMEKSNSAYDSL